MGGGQEGAPQPRLRYPEGIVEYLTSFDLFRGNEAEGRFYANEAIGRLIVTVNMLPPAPYPGARLLELGANPYYMSLLIKRLHRYEPSYANFFGPSEPRAEAEQTVYSERYQERHTFRYAHFNTEQDRFPYPDATFEGVLLCEILEHVVLDPSHIFSEIHRVLNPGGFVLVTTPNMLRWEHLRDLALGRNINDHYSGYGVYGRHNREYAPVEVVNLLEGCGFSVEQIRLADIHPKRLPRRLLGTLRSHWRDNIFALARATGPRRQYYAPWLYRSLVGLRRVVSPRVEMGRNDMPQTGLGWHDVEGEARWTQRSAEVFLRAEGGEDSACVELSLGPAGLGSARVTLRCGDASVAVVAEHERWTEARLPIPPCEAGAEVLLVIEVDALRVPARQGLGDDERELGVLVRAAGLERSAAPAPVGVS